MGDILFLAHRVPFPPNRGDKIRAHHVLKKLAQLGSVHVGCLAENAEDRAGEAELSEIAETYRIVNRNKPLVLAGVEAVLVGKPVSLTAFQSARLQDWVRETLDSKPIDTIVIFSGQMGQYIPEEFRGRFLIDLCDVDSAKFESYASAGERVWLNSREAKLLAREEERLFQRATATILISESEADLFRRRLREPDEGNLQVIGNGIDASFFDPAQSRVAPELKSHEGPHFVFTGQMNYRPNVQAVLWVIEKVLPRLRDHFPAAQFHVVGRNPTEALLSKAGTPGVNITGEVRDVRPYIAGATCVLAPLQIARGVQNKVLEAMAMRRPVVLTPEAATGIAAEHGRHWAIADGHAENFVDAILELVEKPLKAKAMGEAAREFVLANHDWDAMLAPLEELVAGNGRRARHAA